MGNFLQQLQADGVWTLAAVRADAMPQIKDRDTLRAVFGANEGQYYLSTLRGAALDDVIARPARAGDLKFEGGADGKSLEQVLRDEAYLEQDSLPQLQFTLNELYLRRSGNRADLCCVPTTGWLVWQHRESGRIRSEQRRPTIATRSAARVPQPGER